MLIKPDLEVVKMKKLLVIAGNEQQCYYWLHQRAISTEHAIYVYKADHLRGLRGNAFICVGHYGTNPLYDSKELQDAVLISDLFEIRENQVKEYIENQIPYNNKPPLGIIPEKNWKEERFFELRAAISRYADGGYPIKPEWFTEYNKLQKELNRD